MAKKGSLKKGNDSPRMSKSGKSFISTKKLIGLEDGWTVEAWNGIFVVTEPSINTGLTID